MIGEDRRALLLARAELRHALLQRLDAQVAPRDLRARGLHVGARVRLQPRHLDAGVRRIRDRKAGALPPGRLWRDGSESTDGFFGSRLFIFNILQSTML